MPKQEIGKMNLKNSGGFVAKIQIAYVDADGNNKKTGKSGDIPLGQSKTVDPGDMGVPDGASVYMYAFVVWGKDKQARESFTYKKNNTSTAYYDISGTTLSNDLGFVKVEG